MHSVLSSNVLYFHNQVTIDYYFETMNQANLVTKKKVSDQRKARVPNEPKVSSAWSKVLRVAPKWMVIEQPMKPDGWKKMEKKKMPAGFDIKRMHEVGTYHFIQLPIPKEDGKAVYQLFQPKDLAYVSQCLLAYVNALVLFVVVICVDVSFFYLLAVIAYLDILFWSYGKTCCFLAHVFFQGEEWTAGTYFGMALPVEKEDAVLLCSFFICSVLSRPAF